MFVIGFAKVCPARNGDVGHRSVRISETKSGSSSDNTLVRTVLSGVKPDLQLGQPSLLLSGNFEDDESPVQSEKRASRRRSGGEKGRTKFRHHSWNRHALELHRHGNECHVLSQHSRENLLNSQHFCRGNKEQFVFFEIPHCFFFIKPCDGFFFGIVTANTFLSQIWETTSVRSKWLAIIS